MPRVLPSASKAALLLQCSGPFHLDPSSGPSDAEVLAQLRGETESLDLAEVLEEPEDDATIGIRYGRGYHSLMELTIKCHGNVPLKAADEIAEEVDYDSAELVEHVSQSYVSLSNWLAGENPYGVDFRPRQYEVELPLALSLTGKKGVRVCAPTDPETHVYPDIDYQTELPGTADLLIRPYRGSELLAKDAASRRSGVGVRSPDRVSREVRKAIKSYANYVLILDHKTGAHVPPPHELPQLWALALAGIRLTKARGAILATLHAPRGGAPSVYCSPSPIEADKLARFEQNLLRAWHRIGDGSIRPGPHCIELMCPYWTECPVRKPAALQLGIDAPLAAPELGSGEMRLYQEQTATSLLDLSSATPEAIARIAAGLTEFGRLAKALKEPLRERVKELNAAGETIVAYGNPGKRLDVGLVKKRSLSMKSVTDALGKAAGAKELERLTKLGCVKDVEYERIQLKNDD